VYLARYNRFTTHSPWLSHGLLLVLTIWLFSPSFSWIFTQLIQSNHRFSQIALLLLTAFVVFQLRFSPRQFNFQFTINPLAVAGLIVAGSAFLLNELYIAINIFSASCAIIAAYALLGFFMEHHAWQKGILYAVILILFLPFGDYLDVFLGFPLRLASAQAASDLLMAFGFKLHTIQNLIELDNHLSYVDLSCSGIHGLWSGIVFFVLLTWVEQKVISLRWLLVFVTFLALVIALNIMRITVMVILESVFPTAQFADLVHNSLGITAFAIACMSGWLLLWPLKTVPSAHATINHQHTIVPFVTVFSRLEIIASWLLVCVLIIFNFVYTPMPKETVSLPQIPPVFSSQWHAMPIALNHQEAAFFPRQGAYAQKFNFNYKQQIAGSVVFVNTLYWKAHHDPKNCFQAQGFTIVNDSSRRLSDHMLSGTDISGKKMLRQLQLTRQGNKYLAYYWFQSEDQHTDDFSQRLFSALLSPGNDKQQLWTMVSLIMEQASMATSDNEAQLLDELSQITTQWLATLSMPTLTTKDNSK